MPRVFFKRQVLSDLRRVPCYPDLTLSTCRAFSRISACTLHSRKSTSCRCARAAPQAPGPSLYHRLGRLALTLVCVSESYLFFTKVNQLVVGNKDRKSVV